MKFDCINRQQYVIVGLFNQTQQMMRSLTAF